MIDFGSYIIALRDDFREYVVGQSAIFRGTGTQSKPARVELVKVVFLRGYYGIVENYDQGGDNIYNTSEMDIIADQINVILGTSYVVDWETLPAGVWWDDDNGGVWDDTGIWEDIIT